MTEIFGHAPQREALDRLRRIRKLPGTMLLAGSPGIGKRLVARELAEAILCEKGGEGTGGCGECESCRLHRTQGHPDLHAVNCAERDEAKAESIRELLSAMQLRSFSGRARIAILDNAEQLPTIGANALLKELEEPRPGTYYLLISANPGKLPPTLKSRCQVFFFDQLSEKDVAKIIAGNPEISQLAGSDKGGIAALARLADGAVQDLHTLASHRDQWGRLRDSLERIISGAKDEAVLLAQKLSKDKDALRTNLQLLRIIAREGMTKAEEQSAQRKWTELLLNLLTAEPLLFERHLASLPLLSALFLALAEDADFTLGSSDDRLLSSFIV